MDKIKFKPSGGGNPKKFAEMLPYRYIDNGLMCHADKTYAFGMELYSCSDESATDEIFSERFALFRRMILNLNPEITMAIHLKIDPSAPEVLNFHEGRKCDNEIFNRIHKERIEKLKDRIEKRELRRVKIYIFFYYKPPMKGANRLKNLVRSKSSFENEDAQKEIDALNKLKHQGEVFKRTLGNSEFSLKDMTEEDYATVIYQHLNPERLLQTTHIPKLNSHPVRDTLCLSDLFIDKFYIEFGGFKSRIVSLHELPEHTYPNIISSLLHLRNKNNKLFTNFDVTTIISIPDQEKIINKLKRERVKAAGVASDGLKNDIEAEVQLEETTELVEKLRSTSEKMTSFGLYVRVASKDQQELDSMSASVVSAFTSMEGMTGYTENYGNLPIFLDTLPGYPVETSRRLPMTATNASHILPIHRPFEGSRYPAVIFENNAQGIAGYGLNEDKNQEAKHAIIVGKTGSGKSFLLLYILTNFMPFKPIIRIVDAAIVGGTSYEKLSYLVNQDRENTKSLRALLQIDLDSDICINMFVGRERFNARRLNNIANIIEAMVLDPGQRAVSAEKRADIETDIKKLYEKIQNPILSDFAEMCSDQRIKKILKAMWCHGGKYGKLLDGLSTVDLEGDFLVYDLKNLKDYPALQRVMTLTIVDNMWEMCQKYKHENKVIIMDETQSILRSESGQEMIANFYSAMRKANGVALSIAQSLSYFTDVFSKDVKASIFENTGTFFICRVKQSGSVLGHIKKELDLNDSEITMIKNLERVPGEYNDVFMSQEGNFGKRSGIIRVTPLPFELWAFTTDPDDNRLFSEYQGKYKDESVSSILSRLAKDFPKGANR